MASPRAADRPGYADDAIRLAQADRAFRRHAENKQLVPRDDLDRRDFRSATHISELAEPFAPVLTDRAPRAIRKGAADMGCGFWTGLGRAIIGYRI